MTKALLGSSQHAGFVRLPDPVVDWRDLLRAADPTRQPTEGRLRHLKATGAISSGITVRHRSERGLTGRGTLYSGLWGWTLRLQRAGHVDEAGRLAKEACHVETEFGDVLASFASSNPLAALPSAPFFPEIANATARAMATSEHVLDDVVGAGSWVQHDGSFAVISGVAPTGEPLAIHLPLQLLEAVGVRFGEQMWVLEFSQGSAGIIEIVHATLASLPDLPQEFAWAVASGADDDEETAALRYERGPAAIPDAEYLRAAVAAARRGETAVHEIRLAG